MYPSSAVDRAHVAVAVAGGAALRERRVDARQFGRAERDGNRCSILLQVLAALGAGDGHDIPALVQEPGERDLGSRDAPLSGDALHRLHEIQVLPEVLTLEARHVAPPIVGREIVELPESTGEKAAAER